MKKNGRTYGRKTAWLATQNGPVRLALSPGGYCERGLLFFVATPYGGGHLRACLKQHVFKTKAAASERCGREQWVLPKSFATLKGME